MKPDDRIDKLLKSNLAGALNKNYGQAGNLCPDDNKLADFVAENLPENEKTDIENHVSGCKICLEKISLALKASELQSRGQLTPASENALKKAKQIADKTKKPPAGKLKKNLWLIAAIIAFCLSFVFHRYYMQCLVAAVLLGIKWIVESENMRTLILVLDSWRKHEHACDDDISERLMNRRNNSARLDKKL